MAERQSTGLRDFLAVGGSYKKAFEGGKLKIYTGTQPTSADSAVAGTLLCTCTLASGARTEEVRSCGTMTVTAVAEGNTCSSVTVDSVEVLGATITAPAGVTTTTMAALIAAQINAYESVPKYMATSAAAVVTIKAMPGTGTGPNTFVVAGTLGTMTASYAAFGAGGTAVAGVAGVNGLPFGTVTAGVLSKASGVWSGVNVASGTAGCFRLESTEADANGTSTTLIRLDGSCATSGGDLTLSSTTFTAGATHTQSTFDITIPAS
jgi:hypothetical protein